MINIQYSDETKTSIISYFACKQDESIYPNQFTIEQSSEEWKLFYNSQESFIQSMLPPPM